MKGHLSRADPEFVETEGLHLAFYRAGEGPAVLFLHGFPALPISLRHQFNALVEAGYQCIAVDQRGFGASDCPENSSAYAMSHLRSDIIHVMNFLNLSDALVVGHDWGGSVAWQLAIYYPARIRGVISLGTSLHPRFPREPIAARRQQMGDDNYVVLFQEPRKADAILNADISRSIDFMYRKDFMTLEAFPRASSIIRNFELLKELQLENWPGTALLGPAERAAFIDAFERTTFTPGINWYRNITRNWKESEGINHSVHQPSLLVSGADDYFSPPAAASRTAELVSKLDLATVPGGHWFPLESAEQTNKVILNWLAHSGR